MLQVDRRSVWRWRTALRRDGAKALQAKPLPGWPSNLSGRDKAELERLLLEGT